MTHYAPRITAAAVCIVFISVMACHMQAQSRTFAGQTFEQTERSNVRTRSRRMGAGPGVGYATKGTFWSYPGSGDLDFKRSAEFNRKSSEVITRYKSAKSDKDRAAAEKELHDLLSEEFERLMKPRETQLSDLQARLERLTGQLQK